MLYTKEKRTFPADGTSYRGLILEDWRLVGIGFEQGVHCIHLVTKHTNLKQTKMMMMMMMMIIIIIIVIITIF